MNIGTFSVCEIKVQHLRSCTKKFFTFVILWNKGFVLVVHMHINQQCAVIKTVWWKHADF